MSRSRPCERVGAPWLGVPGRALRQACLVASLSVACTAPAEEVVRTDPAFVRSTPSATPPVSTRGHWGKRFTDQVVLVADHIRIEGPDDLSSGLVVLQDSEWLESSTRTTSRGLVQEVRVSDAGAGVVIRAQLGGWSLYAMQSIHVLQRPDRGPVTVVAEGDASWIPVDGAPDKRGFRLVFSSEDPEG